MSHTQALIAHARTLLLIAPLTLLGCASQRETSARPEAIPVTPSEQVTTITRSGRYSLVEVGPDHAQRDLMRQVIDVRAPTGLPTSVADMLRYVLLRSGYAVCEAEALARFETLPLPAVHFHLGPISVREALEVLAGPAWQLSVDDATRQVCFTPANRSLAAGSGAKP
jgi:conjugative transfer region protein (TIGR03748 family)